MERNLAPTPEHKPTWTDIAEADLQRPDRRMDLFEDVVTRGIRRNTQADRFTFLSEVARTLQKATHNAGGFLRRLIETPDYREFITQADEDTARQWLRKFEGMPQLVPMEEPEEAVPTLSNDALKVRRYLLALPSFW